MVMNKEFGNRVHDMKGTRSIFVYVNKGYACGSRDPWMDGRRPQVLINFLVSLCVDT